MLSFYIRGSLLFSLFPIFIFLSATSFSFSFGATTHFSTSHKVPLPAASGESYCFLFKKGKKRQNPVLLLSLLFLLLFCNWDFLTHQISGAFGEENYGLVVSWGTKRFLADNTTATDNEEPPLNSSLILAAKRTYRKDPLDGYKRYTGGWNIRNKHYWAVSLSNLPSSLSIPNLTSLDDQCLEEASKLN